MKTLVVPGNHGHPALRHRRALRRAANGYRQFISADLEPEYEDDEMIVIGVNTARAFVFPFGEGESTSGRSSASVQRLAGVASAKLRVIVTHHPFDLPPGVPGAPVTRAERRKQCCASRGKLPICFSPVTCTSATSRTQWIATRSKATPR
jgi:hypothetical protein